VRHADALLVVRGVASARAEPCGTYLSSVAASRTFARVRWVASSVSASARDAVSNTRAAQRPMLRRNLTVER
jgi:hypothetical protein